MTPLPPDLRKNLEKSVVSARDAAESACEAALDALGVDAGEAPPSLTGEDRQLRNALRAQQRQLGGAFEHLVTECAYEQWHVMLFARFLAENDLLMHPNGAHVTLDEVAELAREGGESDPWLLAAHYAAAMLPGIFRPTDPCVRLPLAPEGRRALEDILAALPAEVFNADDALGWVYQFWQSKKKKEVNASERKIGGADLAPVTQLFTEDYMVRFLLENSLGAWWAARHPDSPLLTEWEYLRYTDDGEPAAGSFDGWPKTVAEVTVMDPCCGSGHFLVAAFDMLRKMREEEARLSARDAADAVLADNLYGLELDARCVQLAAFALAAWKIAGYHELPALNLACSGIPTRGTLEEWTKLAKGEERLERALTRLHELFREADTLGSLIDPRRAVEDDTLMSVPFEEVAPLLERALAYEADPVAAVFGEGAREVSRAATLLAGSYALVATNVPYLGKDKQSASLKAYLSREMADASRDLATAFLTRSIELAGASGAAACVSSQYWRFLKSYESFRVALLGDRDLRLVIVLGSGAFDSISGEVVNVMLSLVSAAPPSSESVVRGADLSELVGTSAKRMGLHSSRLLATLQSDMRSNPDARLVIGQLTARERLGDVATISEGLHTGDYPRFGRKFWERSAVDGGWTRQQGGAAVTGAASGLEHMLYWCDGKGPLLAFVQDRLRMETVSLWIKGKDVWGRRGVAIGAMADLKVAPYLGDVFTHGIYAVVPHDEDDLAAVWVYACSDEFHRFVRQMDQKVSVARGAVEAVPFDLAHWRKVAEQRYPSGLPEPRSDDPTQWLFRGNAAGSERPVHVALARLLGYCWPDQEPDELDRGADEDGIVCLPPVAGERPAHERLRGLLVAAYGDTFSQQTLDDLLAPESSTTLEDWLRDNAFASHAKVFHNRPFIWHIWDGCKDGFAALVNYHKLDESTLQKLTYTYLGWWIDRQKADAAAEVAGAGARLKAATDLQNSLKLILEGEKPYDIYVRWKQLSEQPLGWQPDFNDGVRPNIRPFVTAGVLRTRVAIHWKSDRGKNLDGSARLNDLHTTLAEKRAAREERQTVG
jgi:hypothetical protein